MRFLLSRVSALQQEFEAQTNALHDARDEKQWGDQPTQSILHNRSTA